MLGWVGRKESRNNALRTLQANVVIIRNFVKVGERRSEQKDIQISL